MLSLQPSSTSDFVGLILENADLPYPNHGHVVLGDPSPVLFYPVSTIVCPVSCRKLTVEALLEQAAWWCSSLRSPRLYSRVCQRMVLSLECFLQAFGKLWVFGMCLACSIQEAISAAFVNVLVALVLGSEKLFSRERPSIRRCTRQPARPSVRRRSQ